MTVNTSVSFSIASKFASSSEVNSFIAFVIVVAGESGMTQIRKTGVTGVLLYGKIRSGSMLKFAYKQIRSALTITIVNI